MKKIIGFILVLMFGSSVFAQQITKFGVVDTAKVYNAYFRNSAPVRNYDRKKSEFQQEINKYTDELQKLQSKKVEYEKTEQSSEIKSLIIKSIKFFNKEDYDAGTNIGNAFVKVEVCCNFACAPLKKDDKEGGNDHNRGVEFCEPRHHDSRKAVAACKTCRN